MPIRRYVERELFSRLKGFQQSAKHWRLRQRSLESRATKQNVKPSQGSLSVWHSGTRASMRTNCVVGPWRRWEASHIARLLRFLSPRILALTQSDRRTAVQARHSRTRKAILVLFSWCRTQRLKTSRHGSLLRRSCWSCCSGRGGCSRFTMARGPSLMASGAARCPPIPPPCSGGRSGASGRRSWVRSGRSGFLCFGL
jgi:hypothetical protein